MGMTRTYFMDQNVLSNKNGNGEPKRGTIVAGGRHNLTFDGYQKLSKTKKENKFSFKK